jgi:hypothetical protein
MAQFRSSRYAASADKVPEGAWAIGRDRGRGGAVLDAELGIDLLEMLVDGSRA